MEKGAQEEPPPQAAELWNSRLQKSTRGGRVYECFGAYHACPFLLSFVAAFSSLSYDFPRLLIQFCPFALIGLRLFCQRYSAVICTRSRHLQSKAHQVVTKTECEVGEEFLGGKGCYWRILICT